MSSVDQIYKMLSEQFSGGKWYDQAGKDYGRETITVDRIRNATRMGKIKRAVKKASIKPAEESPQRSSLGSRKPPRMHMRTPKGRKAYERLSRKQRNRQEAARAEKIKAARAEKIKAAANKKAIKKELDKMLKNTRNKRAARGEQRKVAREIQSLARKLDNAPPLPPKRNKLQFQDAARKVQEQNRQVKEQVVNTFKEQLGRAPPLPPKSNKPQLRNESLKEKAPPIPPRNKSQVGKPKKEKFRFINEKFIRVMILLISIFVFMIGITGHSRPEECAEQNNMEERASSMATGYSIAVFVYMIVTMFNINKVGTTIYLLLTSVLVIVGNSFFTEEFTTGLAVGIIVMMVFQLVQYVIKSENGKNMVLAFSGMLLASAGLAAAINNVSILDECEENDGETSNVRNFSLVSSIIALLLMSLITFALIIKGRQGRSA